MTTITCDLSVDWNGCPYCSMLKGCVESAESTVRAASERLDQAYADYRSEREAGRAEIGTGQWSVWQDRLRYLEQQLTAAHDTCGNAIDEWAGCIHTHRRLYEDQQREAGTAPQESVVLLDTEEMPTAQSYGDDAPCTCAMCQAEDGGSAETEEMVTARKDAAVDALVNIYGGHIDKWLEALRERTMAQPTEPTLQERAGYFTERDQCDPDDGAREKSREEARRGIADYMGVPPEDVHAAQYGMPVDASQYIPVAVVKSILTKWETHYTGFRDFLAGRGLNPDGAGCAIFAIKEIRDDINKLTTTEEAPNA